MSEWIFMGEQTEAGIVFQLGMNRSTGQYFRFEPLATRLRGSVLGELRQEIESRSLVKKDQNQAISKLIGPIINQDRYWLGWKARNGQNLFTPGPKPQKSLSEVLTELYPLICSYSLWHQTGLIVGRPEWRRLFKDGNGIFMPDPKPLFYLAKPCFDLPIGLELCHPPEEYLNQPQRFSGDIFYLGLIIFYYLTGELPFSLHKGWPNQAILSGTIVNPRLYRTDLPTNLGQMILSMLAPDPLQRPTVETVKGFWNKRLQMDPVIIESGCKDNLQGQAHYKRNLDLTKMLSQWVIPVILLVLLITGLYVAYPALLNRSNRDPLKAAADFYKEMEHVNLHTMEATSAQNLTGDFIIAAKRRLEMIASLMSKPLFKVERMRLIDETAKSVIIEADLFWWEWSEEGWARRVVRERLVFQKNGKKLILKRRNRLQEY